MIKSLAVLLLVAGASAQTAERLDLSKLDPRRRMDFAVGAWRTTSTGSAPWTTTVERTLMGQVLRMQSTGALTEFVYAPHMNKWRATFLSPLGDHDVLTGTLIGDEMVYEQPIVRGRPNVIARVTFQAVTSTSFDSDFRVSDDGGKSWKTEFTMKYQRAEPGLGTRLARTRGHAPKDLEPLAFLIGSWDVTQSILQPDGTRLEGRGAITAQWSLRPGKSPTLSEQHEILFASWVSVAGTASRSWDTAQQSWVTRRVSNHAPGGITTSTRLDGKRIVEELLRPDGSVQERITYEREPGNPCPGYRVRADAIAPDGTVATKSVWTLRAQRTT